MKTGQIKALQAQFLGDMADFNYQKWVNEKNNQYDLNLNFSGVSHVAKGLADLAMGYAGVLSPLPPFLCEIMGDSLIGAFTCADAINVKAMAIYCDFIHSVVPKSLRIK